MGTFVIMLCNVSCHSSELSIDDDWDANDISGSSFDSKKSFSISEWSTTHNDESMSDGGMAGK